MIREGHTGRAGPASRWLHLADRALTAVEKVFTTAAALSLVVIALVVTTEAVTRYLFADSYAGAETYVQNYLAPAAAFLALGGAARLHRHIGVTLVIDRLPRPARLLILCFGAALVAVIFGLVAYEGAIRVFGSIASHEVSDTDVALPPWIGYVVVPLGSGVLALRMLLLPLLWLQDRSLPVSMAQDHADAMLEPGPGASRREQGAKVGI